MKKKVVYKQVILNKKNVRKEIYKMITFQRVTELRMIKLAEWLYYEETGKKVTQGYKRALRELGFVI